MKDLLTFVKRLLKIIVRGTGAFSLLLLLPLLGVAMAAAMCLYYCVAVVTCVLSSLADEGNLSEFVFPRWTNRSKWIPQIEFD